MKKFFLIFACMLVTLASFAQDTEGGVKVKKVKTVKNGVTLKVGMEQLSISEFSCDPTYNVQAYWSRNGLMKPKKPESHWGYEFGVGINFTSGKTIQKDNKIASKTNYYMVGLFDIPFNVKYFFNPMSTRGKFLWKVGVDFCPCEIGVPYPSEVKKTNTHKYRTLETSAFGLKLGADTAFGYEANKWGIYIGGFGNMYASYSSDASGAPTSYGCYAAFQFFF